MYKAVSFLNTGSRGLSVLLGVLTLGLTLVVVVTGHTVDGLAGWALKMFGLSFLVLLSVLVLVVFSCWVRMFEARYMHDERKVWVEAAQHAANGTATLALTYTLLGISLGINTLADQELNTDTVQLVIGGLTEHFSLAFMTTVVGLPISAGLRALISITEANLQANGVRENYRLGYVEGDKS